MKTRGLFHGFLLAVLTLSVTANIGLADTHVSGPIVSDTTWTLANSPYIVIGSVLVMQGVTLTIEPGVTVKFDTAKALQIDGTLIARGTSGNKVTFTSNQAAPAAGDWGYILFTDSSTDVTYDANGVYIGGSILEYAVVEYAGGVSVNNNGAVRMNSAFPFVSYCMIRNNASSGICIYDYVSGSLKVANSTIQYNAGDGIDGSDGSDEGGGFTIINCTIGDNQNCGIEICNSWSQLVTIDNCHIERNSGGGISGSKGDYTISKCIVNNNSATGIDIKGRVNRRATANISSCTVSNNEAFRAAGICLYYLNFTLDNCIISHNTATSYFGGMWIGGASGSISDSIICYNSALGGGGWEGNAGGIHIDVGGPGEASLNIANSYVCNNFAVDKGGGIATSLYYGGNVTLVVENTVISDNLAAGSVGGGIYAKGVVSISNSSITRNCSYDYPALCVIDGESNIIGNLFSVNYKSASNPNPASALYLNGAAYLNNDNIHFDNTAYELYNGNPQGAPNLDAKNNWWGTAEESEIQAKIYDWFDDSAKGIVDYSPYETAIRTDTPISPPTGLVISMAGNDIILKWEPNPESDVAGYKVYWGPQSAPFFEKVTDVNTSLTYTISRLEASTCYVGVTAYDANYADDNDDPNTIVNENQTNGNESWYATTCLPPTYKSFNDWLTLGKPNCWCGTEGTPQWPYQCDGDADNLVQGLPKYRVYTDDFNILVANWKKPPTDPTFNPCADFDHKPQGLPKYRVYTNDFDILVRNWKKIDEQLPDHCPRPE